MALVASFSVEPLPKEERWRMAWFIQGCAWVGSRLGIHIWMRLDGSRTIDHFQTWISLDVSSTRLGEGYCSPQCADRRSEETHFVWHTLCFHQVRLHRMSLLVSNQWFWYWEDRRRVEAGKWGWGVGVEDDLIQDRSSENWYSSVSSPFGSAKRCGERVSWVI